MGNLFDSCPERKNGDTPVHHGWWNCLRNVLISITGGDGAIAETEFEIADEQSPAAPVTGLSFESSEVLVARVEYYAERASERAYGVLVIRYDALSEGWEILRDDSWGSLRNCGLTFSVTADGQVQYESDDSGAGTMKFRATVFRP